MSTITVQLTDLTTMNSDCIVNAANSQLAMGGGVCCSGPGDAGDGTEGIS